MTEVSSPYMCWGGTVATMLVVRSNPKRICACRAPPTSSRQVLGLGLARPVLPEVNAIAMTCSPGNSGTTGAARSAISAINQDATASSSIRALSGYPSAKRCRCRLARLDGSRLVWPFAPTAANATRNK